jgi:hypothetical protein
MEQRQSPPTDGPPRGGDPLEDPLRDPYASRGTYEEQARGHDRPPPRGAGGIDPATALFVLIDGLRRVVPRELENQMTNVIREFLLTLRSLIDWYLERLDRPQREPRVEDIPIE